jgi:hypothetical protein
MPLAIASISSAFGFPMKLTNQALWDFILKYNPGIKDVTRIPVGKKIDFPIWEEGDHAKKSF